MNTRKQSESGFTLVELLVVMAIIALLLSILLPSLRGARAAARTTVCAAHNRGVMLSASFYLLDFDDWIPGPNTSGLHLHLNQPYEPGVAAPTQDWDWLSPMLGPTMNLPFDRLQRFQELCMTKLRCPENDERYGLKFAGTEDLPMVERTGEHPYILSYLTPAFAHMRYTRAYRPSNRDAEYLPLNSANGFNLPVGYEPRATLLAKVPADKALLFEGGRYWFNTLFDYSTVTNSSGLSAKPQGNFASRGPAILSGSGEIKYYEATGQPTELFKRVGLRHTRNTHMQMGFLDGHVQLLSASETLDPTLYLPSGSQITTPARLTQTYLRSLEGKPAIYSSGDVIR